MCTTQISYFTENIKFILKVKHLDGLDPLKGSANKSKLETMVLIIKVVLQHYFSSNF